MRHIILSFTLLTLVATFTSNAQSIKVVGKIIDSETKKGIAYATISFKSMPLEEDVKILATDIDGKFDVNVPFGSYKMNISAMGYKTSVKFVSPHETIELEGGSRYIDLKEIELVEQPIELDEVLIKPLVEVSADEIIYNLDQDPDREHSTLHEILDKVPMIGRTVDNKLFIEMPGVSFLVVRNGKEDVLFTNNNMSIDQILKAIPAKAFGKVKLMLAPPERYGGYKYVLDIETDNRNILFGVIGDEYLTSKLEDGSMTNGLSALGNLEKLRFSVGHILKGIKAPKEHQVSEQIQLQGNDNLHQEQIKRLTGLDNGIGGGFSYDLAKQHFITGNIMYSVGNNKTSVDNNTKRIVDNIEEKYNIYTRQKSKTNNFNVSANYQYDFTGRARILNIAYKASYAPTKGYSKSEIDGVVNDLDIPYSSDISNHTKEQTIQVHYFDPISSALRLESGASYIFRDYFTNTDYFKSDELNQNIGITYMDSKKHIADAYSSLRYSKKRISASVKVNAYYQNDGKGTRVKDLNGSEEYISETGLDIIPSADISISFPNKIIPRLSLRYLYSRRNPNIRMLSSNIDYSNPNLLITGNPTLKKGTQHLYTIGTSIKSLPINISYSHSGNAIRSYWYKNEDNVTVQSYRNYGKSKSFSISSMPSYYKPPVLIYGMISANYRIDDTGTGEISKRFDLISSLSSGYVFKNKLNLSMRIGYIYTHYSGYYGMKLPPFSISFNGSKSFFKDRLEVEASLSNILNMRYRTRSNINANDFMINQLIEKRIIPLEISMRLSIGSFKVKPMREARRGAVIDDVMTEE